MGIVKFTLLGTLLFFVVGCSEKDDLNQFVMGVKAQHIPKIPPLKPVPVFESVEYSAHNLRTPFSNIERSLMVLKNKQSADCKIKPIPRTKGELEMYSLENLAMAGNIGHQEKQWALVKTFDGKVFRVGEGMYLGFYSGKVTKITPNSIELVELVPLENGCLEQRENILELK